MATGWKSFTQVTHMSWQAFGWHIWCCLDNRKHAPHAAGMSWTFKSNSKCLCMSNVKKKNGGVLSLAVEASYSDSRLQAIPAVLSLFWDDTFITLVLQNVYWRLKCQPAAARSNVWRSSGPWPLTAECGRPVLPVNTSHNSPWYESQPRAHQVCMIVCTDDNLRHLSIAHIAACCSQPLNQPRHWQLAQRCSTWSGKREREPSTRSMAWRPAKAPPVYCLEVL